MAWGAPKESPNARDTAPPEQLQSVTYRYWAKPPSSHCSSSGSGLQSPRAGGTESRRFRSAAEVPWVSRKARMLTKVLRGYQIDRPDRPVFSQGALKILRGQTKLHPSGRLSPDVTAQGITNLVQRVAKEHHRDPGRLWTGVHNMRHSAATQVFREGILKTREVRGWKGRDADDRYARQGRMGPKDQERHHALIPRRGHAKIECDTH